MAITTAEIITETTATTYTSTLENAVSFMSLCNGGIDLITVDVHIVPSGDVADSGNVFIKELTITSLDTYVVYRGNEKVILENGDFIAVTVVRPAGSDPITVAIVTSHKDI